MTVPRGEVVSSEDQLSKPLEEFFRSVERVPLEMQKCRTLYEAVRVSRRLKWSLPIKRLGAVSTWASAKLVSHKLAYRQMKKLISSELDGERWVGQIGGAVHAAMTELDRIDANKKTRIKDRKRTFQQHLNAAIRSLQNARMELAAIGCNPRLTRLIDDENFRPLRDVVSDFDWKEDRRHNVRLQIARRQLVDEGISRKHQWAELINRGVFFSDDPLPNLDNLLQQAITIAGEVAVPSSDRHGVRGQFLRRLYTELDDTSIASVRIAFLTNASDAVFAERVDKSQVRRLVKDVAEEKAAMYARLEAVGFTKDWFRTWGQKKGDISLQSKSSAKSLPVAASGPNNSKQSRSGSGHCEKTQNESACASPRRRSHRTAGNRKPASTEGSLQTHRKKSE